jgi:hypothetical protein
LAEKTTAAKLLVKPGTTAWASHPEHASLLEPLPEGAAWTDAIADATTAVLFADDERSLRGLLAQHADALARPEHLWIAYRKGGRADINRDSLYPIVAELTGMRPITQISLDATWSALRFRPLKPGEAPFVVRR